jgi:hypothetical protein
MVVARTAGDPERPLTRIDPTPPGKEAQRASGVFRLLMRPLLFYAM